MNFPFAVAGLKGTQHVALRAASIVAVAGLLIAGVPHTASAQGVTPGTVGPIGGGTIFVPPPPPPTQPVFSLSFSALACLRETGSLAWDALEAVQGMVASDEPYVLIFVVNLWYPSNGKVFRSNVFSDVDTGERRFQTIPLWGGALPDPSDLVVLVQVMEHDQTDVNRLTQSLEPLKTYAAPYVQLGWGRDAIADKLRQQMGRLVDNGTIYGGPNRDDRVGGVQELRITSANTASAAAGTIVETVVEGNGSGGLYRAHFELRRI